MPSFGIGINPYKRNNGSVQGNTYPIACMAWYAPGYAPVPLLFKFEGYDGVLQTVCGIKILSTANKSYDGCRVYEYICEAVIGGIKYGFKIVFYILYCRWILIF